jgi:hypothetical protein
VAGSWPRRPAEWPEQHNNKDHDDHSQGEGKPPQWSVGSLSLSILRPLHQLRQLGDIGRYAPGFVAREQIRSRYIVRNV